MPSNLPPGVTDSMIPGNRPEDLEWEKFHEQIDDDCSELHLHVSEAQIIWLMGIVTFMKKARKS